jgi:hypothetical protein
MYLQMGAITSYKEEEIKLLAHETNNYKARERSGSKGSFTEKFCEHRALGCVMFHIVA